MYLEFTKSQVSSCCNDSLRVAIRQKTSGSSSSVAGVEFVRRLGFSVLGLLVGIHMNKEEVRRALDACLLTDDELVSMRDPTAAVPSVFDKLYVPDSGSDAHSVGDGDGDPEGADGLGDEEEDAGDEEEDEEEEEEEEEEDGGMPTVRLIREQ